MAENLLHGIWICAIHKGGHTLLWQIYWINPLSSYLLNISLLHSDTHNCTHLALLEKKPKITPITFAISNTTLSSGFTSNTKKNGTCFLKRLKTRFKIHDYVHRSVDTNWFAVWFVTRTRAKTKLFRANHSRPEIIYGIEILHTFAECEKQQNAHTHVNT